MNKMSTTQKNIIGKQAISTVDFNSWLEEPVKQPLAKKKRVKATKEVIHDIFASCAAFVEDAYWKAIFTDASVGKFPAKFTYNDLVVTFRPKRIHLSLNAVDIETTSKMCMEFFRMYGNNFSPTDELISTEYRNITKTDVAMTWDGINKKVQECLISYYVVQERETKKLNKKETMQLRQTIQLGICSKYLGKTNIHISDRRITKIDPLLYNEEERMYYIDPNTKPIISRSTKVTKKSYKDTTTTSYQKENIPQFNTKWQKYLLSLAKTSLHNNITEGLLMEESVKSMSESEEF
jgi:hypothetical protein